MILTDADMKLDCPDDAEYSDLLNSIISFKANPHWWNDGEFDPTVILKEANDNAWDLPSVMMLFFEDPEAIGFTMHGLDEGYGDPLYAAIQQGVGSRAEEISEMNRQAGREPSIAQETEKRELDPLKAFSDLFLQNPNYELIKEAIYQFPDYGNFST